ncbi:MAG: CTP synthase, partial [Chloroflexota bacterium]
DPHTPYPVIDLLPEQQTAHDMGGTMRMGAYPCRLVEGTLTYQIYQQPLIQERHRHRFEFNNAFREVLEKAGLRASGLSPDGKLVEIAELSHHPFMIGTQFHPEFRSRPNYPHPLFQGFIAQAMTVFREGDQPPLPLSET